MKRLQFLERMEQEYHLAVVLTENYGGLAVVRNLGKYHIPVVAVGNSPFVRLSKYCKYIEAKNPAELLQILLHISKYVRKKPVLFMDDDHYVQLVIKHWNKLKEHFLIPLNIDNEQITDKEQLVKTASEIGLHVPKTYIGEAQKTVSTFPVIVKPINANRLFKQTYMGQKKVFLCSSREELEQMRNLVDKYGIRSITQEIVAGDVTNIFCVVMYRNALGKIMVGFVAKKLDQFPLDYGTGSIFQTCDNPLLIEYSVRLLNSVNFVGVADIEYKFDPTSGRYYIIEINGRFPVHTGIVEKLNRHFIVDIYKDLISPSDVTPEYRLPERHVAWIYLVNIFRGMASRNFSWMKKLACLKIKRIRLKEAVWDLLDPLPTLFFVYALFGYTLLKLFKKTMG